jgi:hypothetical protein
VQYEPASEPNTRKTRNHLQSADVRDSLRPYGRRIFCHKTAQFRASLRECLTTEIPSVSNAAQLRENERKNSFLNYESPALTAYRPMLRAETSNIQRPIFKAYITISGCGMWIVDLGWSDDSRNPERH